MVRNADIINVNIEWFRRDNGVKRAAPNMRRISGRQMKAVSGNQRPELIGMRVVDTIKTNVEIPDDKYWRRVRGNTLKNIS
jgi:hypothetical protein